MTEKPYVVLMVDESLEDREFYRHCLMHDQENAYIFLEATSGQAGLNLLQRHRPDVVLLDYRLPDLDGLEFLARVSFSSPQPCGVIMITGHGNEAIAVKAAKAGAQDYLVKGQVTPEGLQGVVGEAVSNLDLQTQRQQRVEQAQLIVRITQVIYQSLNLDEILQTVVDEVRRCLQADRAFVYQFRPDFSGWVAVESIGDEWDSILDAQVNDEYLMASNGEGYRQGRIQVTSDIYTAGLSQCHVDLLKNFQIRANLVVPILQGGRLWGLLVMNQCSGPRQWQVFEIDLLQQLAVQAGIALQKAELYQQAQQELAERKRIETELRESEERFRQLAENIEAVFWITELPERRVSYVSPAYERLWGLNSQDIYENYQTWVKLIHPEEQNAVESAFRAKATEGNFDEEYRIILPDGRVRWIRDRCFPLYDASGTVYRLTGIAEDITDHKQAEAALSENEARLRGFVEANVVGIFYGDIYGNIHEANDELLRIIGYSREDLAAGRLRWTDITPPEYRLLDEQGIAEARERGACTPYEKEYICKDGSRIPVFIGYSLVGDDREESVVFVLDLSPQKRVAKALRRSEDRLRIALESAELGTWDWNLRTNKLTWDTRCKALFGLLPDAEVNIEIFFEGLHPADRDRLGQLVEEMLSPGSSGNYDVEYRTVGFQDGIQRWVSAKGQVYFDTEGHPRRFIGTILDITARKQVEEDLRESKERLQMALEGSGAGLWDWNIATNEDYLSPRWLEMLGYKEGELPQKYSSWEQLIHPDDKTRVMQQLYTHLQDSSVPYRFEYRMLDKSGEWRWIDNYGKVVVRDEQGKPLRMAGIHLDIHDYKLAEAQREIILQREQAAREEAERANRVKDEFLAILSHELRSPLNPILGWSKLLQTRKLDKAKTAQALSTIERNAKLQTQLVDDLLDVARILRGKLKLDNAHVDLSAVIESAIETVKTAAEAKSISLHPELPEIGQVWGDPARLQQIVWNLLSNAIKFTPSSGQVDIQLEQVDDQAQITVKDTGKGISPDFLPYIFTSFRQEDVSITRQYGGLGLGLAIVRYLVEAHGGTIAADSPGEGSGATFTVKFPLSSCGSGSSQKDRGSQQEIDLTGTRVLAVDDNPDVRELLTTLLIQYGVEVMTVASAAEALTHLSIFKPDVLVSDIGMPNMDGYTLIQQIRALPLEQGGGVSAIALTAYAGEADQQQALSDGYQKHIAKPLEIEDLIRAIASLVQTP